jgi:AsmA protein
MSQKSRKSRPKAVRFLEFPMDRRALIAGGAAAALMAVATVSWVLFSPGWAAGALARAAEEQLGRAFSARGGVHLDLSPLSIHVEQPALAGLSEASDSLLTAETLVIPVTVGQLVSRRPDLSNISLTNAEFALQVNERGEASWDFPGARAGQAMSVTLQQASFRYFDDRNGQALRLSNVDGVMRIEADGGFAFKGSAVINSHVARIDLSLKSLPRVNADGSPLELAIESNAASASFSGRLATAKVLSLAGPVSITSREPDVTARWAGIALESGQKLPGPLNVDGALDSAGRAYAIRNAAVTLGQFRAMGDVVADLRGERPKLQANLEAETVWLDALLPPAGAEAGSWGRAVLPLQVLRSIDAEISILARGAAYGSLAAGASRFAATLKDGKLEASGASRLANDGTVSFTAAVDSVVLPPAGSFSLKGENAELEPLIGALTGITALSGMGNLALEVSAQGQTQEQLVSTLQGTANISLSNGQLSGTDVGGLVSAVRERILDGWAAVPGGTPIEALNASVTLADGLATIDSAQLSTAQLKLSLSGTVDLLRRAIDVKAELLPPETAPLPVPVVVRGNWSAPRIYPDIPDILNNPEGGFARLKPVETPPGN